jgi:hypothetical protein
LAEEKAEDEEDEEAEEKEEKEEEGGGRRKEEKLAENNCDKLTQPSPGRWGIIVVLPQRLMKIGPQMFPV